MFAKVVMIAGSVLMCVCCFSPTWAQSSLPVASCTGELAPNASRLPTDGKISVDIPNWAADQVAVYASSLGMVLAPRGWSCETNTGLYSDVIKITPKTNRDTSYGVVMTLVMRFANLHTETNMDRWANTYFPDEMAKEALAGKEEGTTTDTLEKFSTDRVKHLTPLLATYVTPADQFGVGNQILFGRGFAVDASIKKPVVKVPIRGFLKLLTDDGDDKDDAFQINLFAISVPREIDGVVPYVQSYSERIDYQT